MSKEEIDILKELADEKIGEDPVLSREDFLFELCSMSIESGAKQSKAISELLTMIEVQNKKIIELEMRLSVIEMCVMPLVKDKIGDC